MQTEQNIYRKYAEGRARKSPLWRDMLNAFVSGGLICTFAQGLRELYLGWITLSEDIAGMLVSSTLVAIAIFLTALGVFDKIARRCGAGTLVPITGFANAISSSAIDSKSEGFIMGVGAKIFQIAGPVITYGIAAGVVYGLIYWVTTLF